MPWEIMCFGFLFLFNLFNSITLGPSYSFIVRLHFIVSFVPIYYSFCVCLISYVFIFYFFYYKYFCIYSITQEISSWALVHFNFISSQYSLHLIFALACLFHCLHHPWLNTMLLKAHHSISLRFCLALCFYTLLFVTNLVSHFGSHRTSSQALPCTSTLFAFAILHTHTHTLSLSHSCQVFVIFGFSISALTFSPSVTPPASCHTLGFTSSLVWLAHIFEAEASLTWLSDQATHKAPSSPCSTSVRHPPFTSLAVHHRALLLSVRYVRNMYIFLLFVSFSFCVSSSCCKFFLMLRNCFNILWTSWSFLSTMAYIVDANNGWSSTAVALSNTFWGIFAFVATEIVVPLQVCTAFWSYKMFSYTLPLGHCRWWYAFLAQLERML